MTGPREDAPLKWPRLIYNVKGSGTQKCTVCGSWKQHHYNHTSTTQKYCSVNGCGDPATDGAHVSFSPKGGDQVMIVLMCHQCNTDFKNKKEKFLSRRIRPVIARTVKGVCQSATYAPPNSNTHHLVMRKKWARSVPSCGCLSLVEHYQRLTGSKRTTCHVRGCREKWTTGTIVDTVDGRTSDETWVILVCDDHNEELSRFALYLGIGPIGWSGAQVTCNGA